MPYDGLLTGNQGFSAKLEHCLVCLGPLEGPDQTPVEEVLIWGQCQCQSQTRGPNLRGLGRAPRPEEVKAGFLKEEAWPLRARCHHNG